MDPFVDTVLMWIFTRAAMLMAVVLIVDGCLDWIDRKDAAARKKVQNAWKERRVIDVRK